MAGAKRKKPEGRQRDSATVLFLALNLILLAFFILLVAMSQPNKTKEAELRMELRKAFQSFGGSFLGLGQHLDETGISAEQSPETAADRVENFLGELTRFFEDNEENKAVSYEITSEGLIVHVSQRYAFAPGSATLSRASLPVFNSLFNLMLRTDNPVRIEGHSDDTEVPRAGIRDSWALSARRAQAVFFLFSAGGQIPLERFSVVGHGSQRPLASNLTAQGRARNRRVSVTFVGELRRAPGQ